MTIRNGFLAAIAALSLLAGCSGTDGDNDNNDDNGGNNTSELKIAEHDAVSCNADKVCTIGEQGTETTITEDLTVAKTDGVTYRLAGKVFVGDGDKESVLTIEPGVKIYALAGTSANISFLTIRQNAKIMAEGTKEKPIVLTTSTKEGERGRGEWGGLIINGKAPLNSGKTNTGEGGTGKYGGNSPEDSSGKLKYVRVEFAGTLITEENELNGIAFQGVGSGTEVDYIQVHMNKDDGVEFFGGTVNVKHVVLTGHGDDSMDWTSGWQGKAQHVVIQQHTDSGGRGIEADNLEEMNDATPRSRPTISNMTIIGGGEKTDEGILLRRGSGANIYNTIVVNSGGSCLDLDSAATYENAWDGSDFSGAISFDGVIVDKCGKAFDSDDDMETPFTVQELFEAGEKTMKKKAKIKKGGDRTNPDFRIAGDSPAKGAAVSMDDSWFDDARYIGGVGADEDWTAGWTIHAKN